MGEDPLDGVVSADGTIDSEAVQSRIEELRRQAERDVAAFDPPADPPDEDRALEYLRSGAGQAIALYAHLRTGGRLYAFSQSEFRALEAAMNTWLDLYAACYGVDIDSDVSLRTAAEAFVDTEDIADVARVITGVPS